MLKLIFLWIIVVFNLQVIKGSRCPSDWIELESSCYYFSANVTNWHEARRICQLKGGDLAVPKSDAENRAIFDVVQRKWIYRPYIGLFRNESDKEFYTVQNVKPNFTNWHPVQPDNHRGVEDCVHYWHVNTGEWNDIPCGNFYQFICQGEQRKIKYEPVNIEMTLERVDDKAKLSCTAEGNPQPKFEIFLNGSIKVANGSTHVIDKVNPNNVGLYSCQATNIYGSITSSKIRLTVDGKKERITKAKTEWYSIVVTLISGIIIGALVSFFIFLRHRQRLLSRSHKKSQTQSEERMNSADKSYHELDLSSMNKEDDYESLRPKNDTIDITYQGLNISKMNKEDDYESLKKNDESEYDDDKERGDYINTQQ